ncbi:peptide methionine sulfoxide reductase MsrB [Formosa agariphila KMM 3901]|uniref:peptide-methionine (R)-S-oxide reductase n=1 Tax=Formosa agariphila (strain DSM 15362 / KCTC 12365 / LMG 23005 / KMM 3901 / M-2Alg 35-1) TaxID=1347342 RepID=T2KL22_FORAG|nr:peptide-methionine (R)-S-oxide reductase MsrB [Formosa agariphila]CDF79435.1 peptide methionine sulfoxide reductase MsrB [Formosa agariphila KMM 3901]
MKPILLLCLAFSLFSCQGFSQKKDSKDQTTFEVTKTEAEWKAQLTPTEYRVLRQEGTERPFSSPLDKNYEPGTYVCAACETPLFKSEDKFDSGTGWPSFDKFIPGSVLTSPGGGGMYGMEEHCATCGGHLGHVFNDGPRDTTGKRHCINGVALKFIPKS